MVESRKRRKRSVSLVDVLLLAILTLLCLTMLYPFINVLFISVSRLADVSAAKGLMLYPRNITFDAYRYVFRYNNIWTAFENTLFITLVGTALSLLLTTMGGYVLARRDLPGRPAMTVFILITMFFSGGLIPTYMVMRTMGLLNTLWVLIFLSCVSTWNVLLERNFFMGIPLELSESARIDGAGELRLLISIMLPLSLPIIATLGLFYGLRYWNEYTNAIIYNTKTNYQTLQVIVNRMYKVSVDEVIDERLLTQPPTEVIRAATVVFVTAPVLAIYPFLQKYFVKGVMVGSLKG